jgi:hypothetical protein
MGMDEDFVEQASSQREAFIKGVVADFAALRADPKAWAEELAERAVWDLAIADGLEDE